MYQEVFKLHADLLKALAHPRRLEIVNLLKEQELSVLEMQTMLGLPQANLSQHLMLLRKYKVVDCRKVGKQVFYKVTHKNFAKACDLVREILVEHYDKSPLADELNMTITDFLPIAADSVCGMRLPVKAMATSYVHRGRRYYFCAMGCKKRFIKYPNKFTIKGGYNYAA